MKLVCNEDAQPIKDIFINNYNCVYRSICAGCELLVTEEECTYIEYICEYNPDVFNEKIKDVDVYPYCKENTPDGDIFIETTSNIVAYPCKHGEHGEVCHYKGDCDFKIEEY